MKELNEMTKKEKEDFLSNDLIERLIKIEQKISASFGEFIEYNETEYFKNMSEKEKKDFMNYLKRNKKKKYVFGSIFFFLLVGTIFFKGNITGNAIKNTFNISNIFIGNIFLLTFLVFLFAILMYRFFPKKRKKKIDGYFDIINKAYIKKINF